jgi:beta-glucosidase
MTTGQFPREFEWGAATASYQIEGATRDDGRGVSIWDVYCQQPGRVENGDSGDVACDHYHRYLEDVGWMKKLGLQSYRFSIAWPRIQPFGTGEPNPKGLAFYDRLVDALLEAGIRPCVTLYHWDLPQSLQDLGGWANRDTAERFADYATHVYRKLGDRVMRFTTFNEPLIFVTLGHRLGLMAPGIANLRITAAATHHVLYAHGLAVGRCRVDVPGGEIGIAHADTSYEPADDGEESRRAVERARDFDTRLWHDPIYGRGYPQKVLAYYEQRAAPLPIRDGDMDLIAAPTDFLGVNLYTRVRVQPDATGRGWKHAEPTLPLTPMGYERAPHALGDFVRFVSNEYGKPPIYITENGVCDNAEPVNGVVNDTGRIELLKGFLQGLASAVADDAADVRGYYLWSLLDNFEWSFGYSKRFGLIHVDYKTQKRTAKASADWYARVIAANKVPE